MEPTLAGPRLELAAVQKTMAPVLLIATLIPLATPDLGAGLASLTVARAGRFTNGEGAGHGTSGIECKAWFASGP